MSESSSSTRAFLGGAWSRTGFVLVVLAAWFVAMPLLINFAFISLDGIESYHRDVAPAPQWPGVVELYGAEISCVLLIGCLVFALKMPRVGLLVSPWIIPLAVFFFEYGNRFEKGQELRKCDKVEAVEWCEELIGRLRKYKALEGKYPDSPDVLLRTLPALPRRLRGQRYYRYTDGEFYISIPTLNSGAIFDSFFRFDSKSNAWH